MTGFLTGVVTALPTPFCGRGINLQAFSQMIEAQKAAGASGIVVLGTTGEPASVSETEREALIRCAVETAGKKCKVLVGTGSNDTGRAVRLTRQAKLLGADGALAVTPYYNKCTQEGLIAYYEALCRAAPLPVVCYNVPSRTGVNILPKTMARLAKIDGIAGIKEASGNMEQVVSTLRLIRGKCDLYSGEDALNLAILSSGGRAAVSVVSNLAPKAVVSLFSAVSAGDLPRAQQLGFALSPLCEACFCEVNPIPVKEGLNMLGFAAGTPRPPLTPLSLKNKKKLYAAMKRCKLLGEEK